MYNHASKDYKCPLCLAAAGVESEDTLVKQTDIIYKNKFITALINSFFIKNNPGHVIVIPNEHFENLKESYECEGITLLQNNEPTGGQHAFHFHLHVFPRYENDELHSHMGNKQLADPALRAQFTNKLKSFLL